MSGIVAAIFDLDGTLLDTEGANYRAWAAVLKKLSVNLPKREYIREYAGRSGRMIEASLIERFSLPHGNSELSGNKEELLTSWLREGRIELMPYAREALGFFRERMKVAVATGAPETRAGIAIEASGLSGLLHATVSRSEVRNGKPHPETYTLCTSKLGVVPDKCLAFEDTQYGVEAAKSAGMACLAVPGEYSATQDFSMADAVVSDLREAVDWARQKYGL